MVPRGLSRPPSREVRRVEDPGRFQEIVESWLGVSAANQPLFVRSGSLLACEPNVHVKSDTVGII